MAGMAGDAHAHGSMGGGCWMGGNLAWWGCCEGWGRRLVAEHMAQGMRGHPPTFALLRRHDSSDGVTTGPIDMQSAAMLEMHGWK